MNTMQQISKILYEFEKQRIEYAIQRNYEFLLSGEHYEGKDIDTLVAKKSLKKAVRILLDNKFKEYHLNPASNHKAFVKYQDGKLISFHIHIDGVTGVNLMYLPAKKALRNKQRLAYFAVPSKEAQLSILIYHTLLDRRFVQDKYKTKMCQLTKEKINLAEVQYLVPELEPTELMTIIDACRKKEFEKVEAFRSTLRKRFYSHKKLAMARYKISTLIYGLSLAFKKAPLLSVIGMDGTGKTTLTTSLHKYLSTESLIKSKLIYTGRGKNNILPIQFFGNGIYKRMEKKRKAEETVEQKRNITGQEVSQSNKTKLLYTLTAPVFAADLFLRYIFRILPARKLNHIVITDRYSSDMLLMNHVPNWMRRLLYCLFPKPDLTIYLYNKPERLIKRRDHPIKDLYRQEKLFEKINEKIKPIMIKSTNKKQTFEEASNVLLDFLKAWKY